MTLDEIRSGNLQEVITVCLITGQTLSIKRGKIPGYCHYIHHPGCLTRALIIEHDCLGRACNCLEKFPEHNFWKEPEQMMPKKLPPAEKRRRRREAISAKEETNRKWFAYARSLAESMKCEIEILQIKKVENERRIIVYYLSDYSEDDWYLYHDFAKRLGGYLKAYIELRHIKDMHGNYVTRRNRNLFR